jgi:hypothetical protein
MKIEISNQKFMLWLLRLLFRKLAFPSATKPCGIPFNRDPENECNAYEPRKKKGGDWDDCESDGHYLCAECCHKAGVKL